MPDISKDIFSKLKGIILGPKSEEINQNIDEILSDIAKFRPTTATNNYLQLVKLLMATGASESYALQDLFSYGSTPAALGQGTRLWKYRLYETIVEYIPYCDRALSVITDNILSPDDITKQSLEISPNRTIGSESEQAQLESEVSDFIKRTKIEDNLNILISNTLLYGDFFAEISTIEESLISKSFLNESFVAPRRSHELVDSLLPSITSFKTELEYYETTPNNRYLIESGLSKPEDLNLDLQRKQINVFLDSSNFPQEDKGENEKININKLQIAFHNPKYVVKLQSPLFSICFGYLVFPKVPYAPVGALITPNNVDAICLNIIKSIQRKIGDIDKIDNIESDLKDILKTILSNFKETDLLRVRLVSPDRMIHFRRPSVKNFPYGESIFESVQFACRLLIAMETATTVQRLSRAVEKRVVSVEIGVPREYRNLIEGIKESFRKKKVSIDSFGSLDTIPSMITTFEDIYLPMKDGRKFVELDTGTAGNVDIRSRTDELKFIRDSIVAGLCVPPVFLGLEENAGSWQNTLTEQNVLFTRSVITYQKFLSKQIQELLYRIALLTRGEVEADRIFSLCSIVLPVPKSLQFERQSRQISEVAGMIQTLEGLGIPRNFLIEKFLPNIDLKEVERYKTRQVLDAVDDVPSGQETGLGGGEMGGGMEGGGMIPPPGI